MIYEKRLRLFAGPNGSGKSSIIKIINEQLNLNLGVYLNADDLEVKLNKESQINLSEYGLTNISSDEFSSFVSKHSIISKASDNGFNIELDCIDNCIKKRNNKPNSYEASLIINFMAHALIEKGKKLSFESVMSHRSKIELLEKAKKMGYKIYLYYVCTMNPDVNELRVGSRVKKGGHAVPKDKIVSRYYKSLDLLPDAVKLSYRSYIWDNSGNKPLLIMEINMDSEENNTKFHVDNIPEWVQHYLVDKLTD